MVNKFAGLFIAYMLIQTHTFRIFARNVVLVCCPRNASHVPTLMNSSWTRTPPDSIDCNIAMTLQLCQEDRMPGHTGSLNHICLFQKPIVYIFQHAGFLFCSGFAHFSLHCRKQSNHRGSSKWRLATSITRNE